jgi:hypothetical protein
MRRMGAGVARQFAAARQLRHGHLAGADGDKANNPDAVVRQCHVGFAKAASLLLAGLLLQKSVEGGLAAVKAVALV